MIPQTYPSTYESYNGRTSMVVYELTSVIGLQEWIDYIPVKNTLPSDSEVNTYANNGAIQIDSLSSSTGLQAWLNYVPVYQKSTGTAWLDYIPVYRSSTFTAVLTNSLLLRNGTGSPTYTRATTATFTDHENIVLSVLSGEARFQGARRVRNFLTNSEVLTGWSVNGSGAVTGGYTDPLGGVSAYRVVASTAAANSGINNLGVPTVGVTSVSSVWLRGELGGEQVQFGDASNRTTVTLTTSWRRYSSTAAATASIAYVLYSNSLAQTWYAWHPQYEAVTGQSNQAPAEYVSVGVLSTPFHGAGVDGVKYFSTTNGNSVASNVVTEASGSPISASTLLGYLAEGARTNLCLQSEDFLTTWATSNVNVSSNATTAPNGNVTADLITPTTTPTTSHRTFQTVTLSAVAHVFTVYIKPNGYTKFGIRETSVAGYYATFNTATVSVLDSGAGGTGAITAIANGWYRVSMSFTATAGANIFSLYPLDAAYTTGSPTTYNYTADGVSGVYQWGAQLEAGSFASTYIPTTTASVVRNADALTYPFSGNALAATGSAYAELSTQWTVSGASVAVGFSVGESCLWCPATVASTTIRILDGVNSGIKTGLTDMSTGSRKRSSSWGGSTISVTGDGATVASNTFDGGMGSTSIGIGNFTDGSTNWFGTIRNVRIYQTQLSASQLQAVTA